MLGAIMWYDVQADVLAELAFDPNVDSCNVSVAANAGAVSLRGTVGSVRHVRRAQDAARRIRGVTSVRNYLRVRRRTSGPAEDAEIRAWALQALMLNVTIPDTIYVDVANGVVHLSGTSTWQCEREEAELVCTAVPGVRGVVDEIELVPAPADGDMRGSIISAYRRNASLTGRLLSVKAIGSGIVILSGTVTSSAEHDQALAAAWSAPGIRRVDDRIMPIY